MHRRTPLPSSEAKGKYTMRHEVQRRRGSGVDVGSGSGMMFVLEGEFGFDASLDLAARIKFDHIRLPDPAGG